MRFPQVDSLGGRKSTAEGPEVHCRGARATPEVTVLGRFIWLKAEPKLKLPAFESSVLYASSLRQAFLRKD